MPRGSKREVLNHTEVIRKSFMNDVKTLGVNLATDGLNLLPQSKNKQTKQHKDHNRNP